MIYVTSQPKTASNCFIGVRTLDEEQKQRWMDYSREHGISLTKLIIDSVEANTDRSSNGDYIGVRVHSPEQKQRWLDHCLENNMTLDEMLMESVEANINPPEEVLNAFELKEKLRVLETLLQERDREISRNKRIIESLEADILAMQDEKFSRNSMGVKRININMTQLLKRHSNKSWSEKELFSKLHIDTNNISATKAIANQLRDLEDLGLVQFIDRGWRWVNE